MNFWVLYGEFHFGKWKLYVVYFLLMSKHSHLSYTTISSIILISFTSMLFILMLLFTNPCSSHLFLLLLLLFSEVYHIEVTNFYFWSIPWFSKVLGLISDLLLEIFLWRKGNGNFDFDENCFYAAECGCEGKTENLVPHTEKTRRLAPSVSCTMHSWVDLFEDVLVFSLWKQNDRAIDDN
jgi:hypothetical protein